MPYLSKSPTPAATVTDRPHLDGLSLGTMDPGLPPGSTPTPPRHEEGEGPAPVEASVTAPGYSSELFPDFHHPDPFDLPVHEEFRRQPYHCRRLRGRVDIFRLLRDHGDKLLRSDVGLLPNGHREVYRALLNPMEKLFVRLEESELAVYSPCPHTADSWCMVLRSYVTTTDRTRPCFIVISMCLDGPHIEYVEVSPQAPMDVADLALHYGDDFPEWQADWLARIDALPSGLSVFTGPPGTGKTSYLRSMVSRLAPEDTHRFYYVPATSAAILTSPEFVSFWIRQNRRHESKRKVVIFEDAEDLLLQRDSESRGKVSNLLNATDGFLSDQLRIHIIATVNCPVSQLDPAVIRPGRLVGYREFRRLTHTEARRLAETKCLSLPEAQDHSLAEVYSAPPVGYVARPERHVGFGR